MVQDAEKAGLAFMPAKTENDKVDRPNRLCQPIADRPCTIPVMNIHSSKTQYIYV